MLTLAAAVLSALLAVPARAEESAAPTPAAATVDITILHINDPHGQLEPYAVQDRSVGGYARVATLVDDIRRTSTAARVFLLHAGDEFSRGDALTQATRGAANVAVMNHLRFDAWTPGNGDVYEGLETLQARIQEARFPVLAANLRVKATGRPLARSFIVEKAGPVRVAVFGLCWLHPLHESFEAFLVDDQVETARRLVPELRRQADLVVLLSHLGGRYDKQVAESVEGLDVIIGGHSHTVLPKGVRVKGPGGAEVLICQTGEQLQYLGSVRVRMEKAGAGYRVRETTAQLIAIDGKVKMDPAVTALIARLAEAAGAAPSRPPAPAPAPAGPVPAPAAPAPAPRPAPVGPAAPAPALRP